MPKIDKEGSMLPNEPITEATVRGNIELLLDELGKSPENCDVYRSVMIGLVGFYGTRFAAIAGESVRQADQLHREAMGDRGEHLLHCPLSSSLKARP